MRVSVIGLGPGPVEWVSPAAVARLRAPGAVVFFRTRHFPVVSLLDLADWQSFDDLYDSAGSLDEVHSLSVARLLEARAEEVVLAVPGDGVLGEAVLDRLHAAGCTVEVIPGAPLATGALAAAGVPAESGAQFVEATSLSAIELNPCWAAVATGIYNPRVAGDLKLALQRVYPSEHTLVLVHRAGLPEARVERLALPALDRAKVEWDHLTHAVIPPIDPYSPTGSSHAMRAIVARLRAPDIGCPWDLQQTHRTLIPYAIEEAYEVVDAIESDDMPGLADELGDLLLQVALHAEIADQEGDFEWNDVVRNLCQKLVRRHPHVFGSVLVSGAADVVRNWDQLKAAERSDQPPPTSALDGVATSLPQLRRAAELARRATKAGFDWPSRSGTIDKVREELAELLSASSVAEKREELGDLLYILAKLAAQDGIDPEEALRAANAKFARRFAAVEQIARERGWPSLHDRPLADLEDAWREAKRSTLGPNA